jgi:hypothetical protein
MFAPAEITRHAQRLGVRVDDDHRVGAILVARPAMIFDRLPRPVLANLVHGKEENRITSRR